MVYTLTRTEERHQLIFNPLIQWWRLGPINKQLRVFLWSAAPVHYKISMMAYMYVSIFRGYPTSRSSFSE